MKKTAKKFVARYLRAMSRSLLIRFRPQVIAVAGTLGKTRTKEMIRKILIREFTVRANQRSYNTDIGLPLAILHLNSGAGSFWRWLKVLGQATLRAATTIQLPSLMVLEMGTDEPGDMDYLLSIVRPHVLVITNISTSHLGQFEDAEQAAQEIEKAVRALPESGLLIINQDDAWARHMSIHAKCRVISYGKKSNADIYAKKIAKKSGFLKVLAGYKKGKRKFERELMVYGTTDQHLYALLAAVAVGIHYNIGLTEASKLLAKK